jgi:hypothetical protein
MKTSHLKTGQIQQANVASFKDSSVLVLNQSVRDVKAENTYFIDEVQHTIILSSRTLHRMFRYPRSLTHKLAKMFGVAPS